MSTSNTPRERGILFSAPMVRALLAGTKTQTRRIVKVQPPEGTAQVFTGWHHPAVVDRHGEARPSEAVYGAWTDDGEWGERCPFGQVGDRLWVRENFMPAPLEAAPGPSQTPWNIAYAAGGQVELLAPSSYNPMLYNYERWTPSIHMPRWASRITLEITGVRVERLQDISEDDALAEGIRRPEDIRDVDVWDGVERDYFNHLNQPVEQYRRLWNSINGAGSWDANPWVWCVEFRVLGTTTTSKESR